MPPVPFTTSHDADADRHGDVVLAAQADDGIDVHFLRNGTTHRFRERLRYPGIRWIDASRVLLFDARSADGRHNAWILDDAGRTVLAFSIGDAVQDVVWTEKYLVVTYFDEGVFGHIPVSQSGVAIFSHGGEYLWGWNAGASSGIPEVDDCYAAGYGGGDVLGVLIYTSFHDDAYAFGVLDVDRWSVTMYEVLEALSATRALARTADGTWLFALARRDERRVIAWRPGSAGYGTAPAPVVLTRGLADGRFISVTEGSVEVIQISLVARGDGGPSAQPAEVWYFKS
jgi:hypothetical protein